jgi:hypothetical protein
MAWPSSCLRPVGHRVRKRRNYLSKIYRFYLCYMEASEWPPRGFSIKPGLEPLAILAQLLIHVYKSINIIENSKTSLGCRQRLKNKPRRNRTALYVTVHQSFICSCWQSCFVFSTPRVRTSAWTCSTSTEVTYRFFSVISRQTIRLYLQISHYHFLLFYPIILLFIINELLQRR